MLRLGGKAGDSASLEAAARRRGVPLEILDLSGETARDLYGRDLVLIRPDQHVAWRDNRPAHDPDRLWDTLVGSAALAGK